MVFLGKLMQVLQPMLIAQGLKDSFSGKAISSYIFKKGNCGMSLTPEASSISLSPHILKIMYHLG